MPELPEVETIAQKLNLVIAGKRLGGIKLLHPKPWSGQNPAQLFQSRVESVGRRAKILIISLTPASQSETETTFILIHLKMTGQLIFQDSQQKIGGGHPTSDWIEQLPGKHTRVVFNFDDNSQLFFNDQRLFGWIRAVSQSELSANLNHLAPDVIDDVITPEYFFEQIRRRSQSIKQVLMDNSVASGVGNIYACEALNLAKIHPARPAKSLSFAETRTLIEATKTIIHKGIELGGTTFDGKYVDVNGMAGQYQSVVRVYGKTDSPCPNCQYPIMKMKLGGRGTYFCGFCQQ